MYWNLKVLKQICFSPVGKRPDSILKYLEEVFDEAIWRQPSIVLLDDLDHVVPAPSGPEAELSGEAIYGARIGEGMTIDEMHKSFFFFFFTRRQIYVYVQRGKVANVSLLICQRKKYVEYFEVNVGMKLFLFFILLSYYNYQVHVHVFVKTFCL